MEECRFEHGDCVIHSPTGGPTTHRGPPALCCHAAADLEHALSQAHGVAQALERRAAQAEQRGVDAIVKYETLIRDLEARLASLDEEKAQQTARSQENERSMVKAWDEIDRLKDRLTRAEARAAAMREALRHFPLGHYHWDNTQQAGVGCELCIRQREYKEAALSPDAGRAPVNEVEALREVARVLQNTTPEALRQLVTEFFMQGRSAWAYLFTDLATALDALATRGEEGE